MMRENYYLELPFNLQRIIEGGIVNKISEFRKMAEFRDRINGTLDLLKIPRNCARNFNSIECENMSFHSFVTNLKSSIQTVFYLYLLGLFICITIIANELKVYRNIICYLILFLKIVHISIQEIRNKIILCIGL